MPHEIQADCGPTTAPRQAAAAPWRTPSGLLIGNDLQPISHIPGYALSVMPNGDRVFNWCGPELPLELRWIDHRAPDVLCESPAPGTAGPSPDPA